VKSIWNGALLAESDTHTTCPWKGWSWYYPDPKPKAARMGIKDHVAFGRGVKVEA